MKKELQVTDRFLMETLMVGNQLQAQEVDQLTDWWRQEGEGRDSLVAFLTKKQILTREASRTIDLMQRGYLQRQDATPLLTIEGLQLVRERCRQSRTSGMPPAIKPPAAQLSNKTGGNASRLPAPGLSSLPSPAPRRLAETSMMMPHDLLESPGSVPPESSATRPQVNIGDTLGRCLLTEFLGQGGCCQVYRALHQGLNVPVAVKILRSEGRNGDDQLRKRFQAEARLLAQLDHPNIVRVLDFDSNATCPYLILELVQGLSLHELIQHSGRLQLDRATSIMLETIAGLAVAWRLDIIHRDIKPSNILLTREASVKLADLGLALRLTSSSGVQESADDLVGTAFYISPEQALSSAQVDHRADIYSLGATFYHAVTGQVPFRGRSCQTVLLQHLQETPQPPVQLVPEIGQAASDLILWMMAKDPDQRPQDAEELAAALRSLLPDMGSAARRQRDIPTGTRSTQRGLTQTPSQPFLPRLDPEG